MIKNPTIEPSWIAMHIESEEPLREIMASLMRAQQYGRYIAAQKSFGHWPRPIK